jgi:preprotein translocase subunit SecG
MSTFTIFLILIIFVAFLLVIVIMVQNPKGGGLSSSFGGGGTQQLGGVKKTTDFLDKSTWTLSIILIALILLSNIPLLGTGENTSDSRALDQDAIDNVIPATDQALPPTTDTDGATN